jgi:hypothetical protein
VEEMSTDDILIITVLTATVIILGGPQISYGNALNVLNKTNTNITDVNGAGGNATVPGTQTDSLSEDDKMGNIASLPGKCLGSALCPD